MALITGSTSGIAQAITQRFVGEGAQVVITGRDAQRGEELEQRLGVMFVGYDVTRDAQVEAAVQQAIARLGRIDVLFNNAGIINFGTVTSADVDEWDALMATNVRGVFLVSRHVLPRMIAGDGVINMGSYLGLVGTLRATDACNAAGLRCRRRTSELCLPGHDRNTARSTPARGAYPTTGA